MNALPICRLVMMPVRRDRRPAKAISRRPENAVIGARSPKSSRVTAYDMLCTRWSPVAAR